MTEKKQVPAWRHIVAFILDLVVSFALFGWIIAKITGNTTDGGFQLSGTPALILFAAILIYFVGLGRMGGGTVFQRILRTK